MLGADVLDVSAALSALVPYGREDLPLLSSYLGHASADLRQSAAAALGAIGDAEAIAPLRARFAVEHDSGVRLTVQRAIRSVQQQR